jgi:hypothetical protein
MQSLCPICKTIFYILLLAYVSGLESYFKCSNTEAISRKKGQASLPGWKDALDFAKEALTHAVHAATKATNKDPDAMKLTNTA